MRNIRLDLSYDGKDYAGWQIQKNALSVQECLQQALEDLSIDYTGLVAAGRTDSGVHAINQVVNFYTQSRMPTLAFRQALNTKLPEDIVVMESQEVGLNFHARYSALAKHYSYRINLASVSNPFAFRYTWHYPYQIDYSKVKEACQFLSGKHDYRAFRKVGSSTKGTVREIYTIHPSFTENSLILDFVGNGFLYNMVRILSGTILEFANGKISSQRLRSVFDTNTSRNRAGITAPPKGLFLEKIFYSKEDFEKRIQEIEDDSFRQKLGINFTPFCY